MLVDNRLLDFYDIKPNNQERMSKVASEILAKCQGKTLEEILYKLSSKFSPKEIVGELEKIHNEVHIDHNKLFVVIEKLRECVNVCN